jgi:hypothetical protein
MRIGLMVLGGVLLAVMLAWGPIANRMQHAPYTVKETKGSIETRIYPAMIAVEIDIRGSMNEGMWDGYDILEAYLNGKNASSRPLAVTTPGGPMTQTQPNEKVAMILPVMQTGNADATWKVRLFMPQDYTMETLPKPANPLIRLVPLPERRMVAVKFSGGADEKAVKEHSEEIQAYLKEQNIPPRSNPVLALYNPVWTVPFLRRNEVMIEIDAPAVPSRPF